MEPRPLPDIRALTEDSSVDWPARAWAAARVAAAMAGIAACWGIAGLAWVLRHDVSHPAAAYGVAAGVAFVAGPLAIVIAWRRDGSGLAASVATFVPMFTFLVVIIFHAVAKNLDGLSII